ncbi:hypothetical protein ACJX0J_039825, partial [Zea mays]
TASGFYQIVFNFLANGSKYMIAQFVELIDKLDEGSIVVDDMIYLDSKLYMWLIPVHVQLTMIAQISLGDIDHIQYDIFLLIWVTLILDEFIKDDEFIPSPAQEKKKSNINS